MTIALGIDPGIGLTGYGVVKLESDGNLTLIDYGAIETPPKMPMPERLMSLYQELQRLILLHKPDISAVEKLFFARNVTTAISVGQARGVAMLSLAQAGIPIGEYTPNEIKQSVTGYGGADKRQVQVMVQMILNMDELPKPDDAADGLAVAICHLHQHKINSLYDN
jgi:crossover junction endodeoxyribonuclease RuvC